MKILVYSGALTEKHKEMISEAANKVGADLCFTENANEVPAGYEDTEIVYGYGMNIIGADNIRMLPNLKWISITSAGVDYLFKPGLFKNEDVIITNASGAYGVSIAEHIIAVSLMMMRSLTYHYSESSNGRWANLVMQKSLKDCRITVLGTGDIGSTFARRAKAFEPAVITGVCRSGKCDDPVYDEVFSIDHLDEILPSTELLVMSLPATKETEGILSRERINLLPEGAYIVNVGRGSAIDEDALYDALQSDRLGGAALDVFRKEPLPSESNLWNAKNILITPHSAGNLTVPYTVNRNVELFCENLLRYAEGNKMNHVVDKNTGY